MEVLRCIIDIFPVLLTPLIAIIAIYIAYQQYKVNKHRFTHELYEKRIIVFKAVMKFISKIIQESSTDIPTLSQFYADTS